MMKLILLCLLPLSAISFDLPLGAPQKHDIQRNKPLIGVYGAKRAHIQQYPYTVSILTDEVYAMYDIVGSGAVLNQNWILCTASQLNFLAADNITIRGGSDDGYKGGQSSGVAKMILNITGPWSMNVALLKTENKLIFNKKLKPIKLATTVPKEGSVGSLSGYGLSYLRFGQLTVNQIKISSYKSCRNFYGSDTIICSDKSDKYQFSNNDLGSPLVQNNQLVAFYNGESEDGHGPHTFMPVAILRDWIIQTIKENSEDGEAKEIDDEYLDVDAYRNGDINGHKFQYLDHV